MKADNFTRAETYYADIFSAPHWEPALRSGKAKHPRMPMSKRAAIFAPFDCLSGYKSAIEEVKNEQSG